MLRLMLLDRCGLTNGCLSASTSSSSGLTVTEAPHYVWRELRGFESGAWKTPQELAAYDLVVLANVDLKTLALCASSWAIRVTRHEDPHGFLPGRRSFGVRVGTGLPHSPSDEFFGKDRKRRS